MVKDNTYFHNVCELEEVGSGVKLHRFPIEVEKNINLWARERSRWSCGCELRFVTDGDMVEITLTSNGYAGDVQIFYGDYPLEYHNFNADERKTIILSRPKGLKDVTDNWYENNRFNKNVWRVYLHGRFIYNSIDSFGYDIRPPHKEEVPEKTLLTWGSSITHGAGAMYHQNAYVNQLARRLGCDVLIKGTGGSCHCEKEIVDWICDDLNWDTALIEPATNMYEGFEPDEFERRTEYMFLRLSEIQKPTFVTTVYPNSTFFKPTRPEYEKIKIFDEIVREKCKKYSKGKMILVEGREILTDTEYLTADGIHPNDYGHFMMGNNWYEKIKKYM